MRHSTEAVGRLSIPFSREGGLESCFLLRSQKFSTPRQPRKSRRLLPPLHGERVNTAREEPTFQLEFYMRDVTDGLQSP